MSQVFCELAHVLVYLTVFAECLLCWGESLYDAVVEVVRQAMGVESDRDHGEVLFCSHFSYPSLVPGNPRGGLASGYI